jgi:hypothetical protein
MNAWEKHIDAFYAMISGEEKLVYQPIINKLVELGYTPMKKNTKGYILSFSKLDHNRVLARFGIREGNGKAFFGLRFSSCANYSDKFAEVVRNRILSSNNRLAKCGECGYCKGDKFVYTYTFPNGEAKAACGAFVLEIPNVAADDIDEIKRLIDEQHLYFMKYAV